MTLKVDSWATWTDVENGANLECEACEEVVAIKFSSFDQ